MSGYSQGREVEWRVIHHLTDAGYVCTRAASSKGAADVIAIKEGQALLVSVKRSSNAPPAERAALIRVADMLPGVGVPIVAIGRPALTYWRLLGEAPGARVAWTPDEVNPA